MATDPAPGSTEPSALELRFQELFDETEALRARIKALEEKLADD